jgi:hypothetical protein
MRLLHEPRKSLKKIKNCSITETVKELKASSHMDIDWLHSASFWVTGYSFNEQPLEIQWRMTRISSESEDEIVTRAKKVPKTALSRQALRIIRRAVLVAVKSESTIA